MKQFATTTIKALICVSVLLLASAAALAGRPVARWDVVPGQTIDNTFKIGVVAFHIDGVEVEFSVDSTLVYTAQNPSYNDRTGVWEYWFSFDPSSYSDGPVSIDAKCVPQNLTDPDYDLPTITMYANSGGTLSCTSEKWVDPVNGLDTNDGSEAYPYATIAKALANTPAGATIYLEEGTHIPGTFSKNLGRSYWTTVRPADGVNREDVIIDSCFRPRNNHIKWESVSFIVNLASGATNILNGDNGATETWVDDCYFENSAGRWVSALGYFGNSYIAYVTGGESYEMDGGPMARLIRDHQLNTIRSDAWSGGGKLVVNSSVDDINAGSTGDHPDFHQSYSTDPYYTENVILYNVKGYDCASQGLFGIRLKNAAFVNILFERVVNSNSLSQYSEEMENVLFAHITLINQSWLWKGEGDEVYDPTDVYFVNNILPSMGYYEDAAPDTELVIDYNHFIGGTAQGTNATTGAVLYVDESTNDYSLQPSSPAAGNGRSLQCVPADIDGNAYAANGRNRGCYSSSNAAPTADAGSDQSVNDTDANGSETVTLDGSGSSDSDGSIVSYVWTENSVQIATGISPNVTLTTGEHTIELTVTDNGGTSDTDTVVIDVNAPPVADAGSDQSVTDSDGDGSQLVSLNAAASSDSDGTITSYAWSIDATPLASGATPSLTMAVGTYSIDLTVTDNDSLTDSDSMNLSVYSRTLTSVTGLYNWPVNVLPSLSGTATVEFDAIANDSSIDGVIGLACGAGDWWNELAAIVRFNTSGYIDVRDGSSYDADAAIAYDTITSYHFRMELDITNHTYSVYATPAGASEQLLAEDYSFRTEQLGVSSLDHWTLNSTVGTHTVSNLTITD